MNETLIGTQRLGNGKAAHVYQETRCGQTIGHMSAITAAAAEGYKLAIYNQQFARKKFEEIQQIVADLREQIRDEIEPYLERQAPDYEKRLARLEAIIEELSMPSMTERVMHE